jgi:hypothetical protein
MIMNLVIAIAMLRVKHSRGWLLISASGLFLSGCIVAGQFSGFIGLGIVLLVFGFLSGRLHRLLAIGVPATVVTSVVFWPVIATRLRGFDEPAGLPHSWTGRWANLQHFFLPELLKDLNWLVGVRPAPRLPATETWREWIYIESGYVWLLWIGGLPLLASFIYCVWVSAKDLLQVIRERADVVWVASVTSFAYLMLVVTLMLFDPHLTVRGSADLFFPLLALSFVRARETDAICRLGKEEVRL